MTKVDNVTIHLFLYPVLGPDSVVKSRNIWCAKDKAKTWDRLDDSAASSPTTGNCDTAALTRNRRVRPEVQHHRHADADLQRRHAHARRHPRRADREATRRRQLMSHRRPIHYRVECADRQCPPVRRHADHRPAGGAAARGAAGVDSRQLPGARVLEEPAEPAGHAGPAQAGRCTQLDKCSWQIDCAPDKPLVLRYEVCAYDNSVRTAWLDADRGFFNGTSLCLQVEGQADAPHALEIVAPPRRWPTERAGRCATALPPTRRSTAHGFGHLPRRPTTTNWPTARSRWAPSGAPTSRPAACRTASWSRARRASFDGERLMADTQAICETQMRFWHGDKVGKRGGAEAAARPLRLHAQRRRRRLRRARAPPFDRADLHPPRPAAARRPKQPEGYTTLLGLISHEYFHTWNVKRLRPAEFARYDYGQRELHAAAVVLRGLHQLLRRPAAAPRRPHRRRHLPAAASTRPSTRCSRRRAGWCSRWREASFDAWVKYYRQDEQTPNTTVELLHQGRAGRAVPRPHAARARARARSTT